MATSVIVKNFCANCFSKTLEIAFNMRYANCMGVSRLLHRNMETRPAFETFKSNICHLVKDMGDIDFLIDAISSDRVFSYLNKRWYREALYLLAMVDYLCRENAVPLHEGYEDLRRLRLSEIVYPAGILILSAALGSDEPKERSLGEAIPEFLRHNIVENRVRDVA